jgi:two-component system phosphate regulon sensor histidine kinase PhoR
MLVDRSFSDLEETSEALRTLAAHLGVRITYMDLTGTVLTDSAIAPGRARALENHMSRPEVAEALDGALGVSRRYSDTLGQYQLYVAERFPGTEILPEGIVRVARPASRVHSTLDSLYGNVGWVYAASILLAFGLISLLSRQILRSISSVAKAAADIGQGGTGRRIRITPSMELAPLVSAFNNMLERIDADVQTITEQKAESEAVLNGMYAGVIILDAQGRILRGNYSALEIFPDLSSFTGHKPMEMALIQDLQDACDAVLERRCSGDLSPIDINAVSIGDRIFDVSVVPVREEESLGAIMVFHDITEVRRAERVRRDFVANVSHELRTPLTSIKGYAETLMGMDEADRGRADSFLEVILRNANHMQDMVDELLHLSQLEHGRRRADFVSVDPAGAVNSAWKGCQPVRKDISFTNELPVGEYLVRGDFGQLVQVFRNILENAVKYVPEQEGRILVYGRARGENVEICLEDNGPGIPKEDQDRVFERFYRVEKDRNSAVSGTGLGLSISRHIVVSHGGRLSVRSPILETGRGSRFIVTLPLADGPSEDQS